MLGGSGALLIVLLVLWTSSGYVKSKTVGYGQHILREDVITKMGKARKIAKDDTDIEGNYGGQYACEVTIDKDTGDITLNYNKVKKKGCFVDLLTHDEFSDNFGFTAIVSNDKGLKDCLRDSPDWISENQVPFAYSIDTERFKELSDGPPYSKKKKCPKMDECKKRDEGFIPDCLNRTGLEIAWGKKSDDSLYVSMMPVGDRVHCEGRHKHDTISDEKSQVNVHITGEDRWFNAEPMYNKYDVSLLCNTDKNAFICTSSKDGIIEPKAWEIEDKRYKNEKFKYLLVFYLLPQSASRWHYQGWYLKNKLLTGPICNVDFKFSGKDYKLLVNVGEEEKSEEESESSGGLVIFFIIVFLLILVIISSALVWFFLINKDKDKTKMSTIMKGYFAPREGTTKSKTTKPLSTTVGTTQNKLNKTTVGNTQPKSGKTISVGYYS